MTLASVGPGTPHQIAFEMLKRSANLDVSYVPYPGDAPVINALLGEHLHAMITAFSSVASLIESGKVRALATTSKDRLAALPNVPTIGEAGHASIDITPWYGTVAPAGTPEPVIDEAISWFKRAIHSDEVEPKLLAHHLVPVGQCGGAYAAYLREQNDNIGRIVRAANIRER